MRSLPDELLLSAGSVGGRSSDTQNLLYGLQHCALAAAVGARHKVDVGTADRHKVDVGTAGRGRNDMWGKILSRQAYSNLGNCSHSVRTVQVEKYCSNACALAGLQVRLGTACCKCAA